VPHKWQDAVHIKRRYTVFGTEGAKSKGMESFDFTIVLNFYMREPKYFLHVFFCFSVTITFRKIHLSALSYKGTLIFI
jgi:hypothetical protein